MPTRTRRKSVKKTPTNHITAILVSITILLLVGILMVFDASVVEAFYRFEDKFHFIRLHLMWVSISLVAMLVVSKIPLEFIKKYSHIFFFMTIILLVAVLIPGLSTEIKGARRWLRIGSLTLQPSELAKLACMVYFPSWLSRHQQSLPFLLVTGLVLVLLMLEPDLGTSVIIATIALGMFFASGAKLRSIAAILLIGATIGSMLIISSPYRMQRLQTFLDPSSDPLGSSYHIRQVLISLGSGGFLGTGIGRSRQKYQYLPEASTDSIFAVIAEELGFVGGSLVVGLYALLIFKLFQLTKNIEHPYARIMSIGGTIWIGSQTLMNISAMVALVPLTGVPLPLISYGGSSLLTVMIAIGLIFNASKK